MLGIGPDVCPPILKSVERLDKADKSRENPNKEKLRYLLDERSGVFIDLNEL